MLVLTRKVGERIQIGDQITLSVIRIQNGKVRIGIEAPDSVRIRREELGTDSSCHDDGISPQEPCISHRKTTVLLSCDLPAR